MDGAVGDGYLSERFREYRRDAKLPDNSTYQSLRHAFASWFILRGGDLYRIEEIPGNADMKTTLKYAHLRLLRFGQKWNRPSARRRRRLQRKPSASDVG